MAGRHGGHLPRAAPWLGRGQETQVEAKLLLMGERGGARTRARARQEQPGCRERCQRQGRKEHTKDKTTAGKSTYLLHLIHNTFNYYLYVVICADVYVFPALESSGARVAQAASVPASNTQTAFAGRGWNGRSSRARWIQGMPLLAPTSRYFRAGETDPSLRRHQTPAKLGSRPNGPGRGRKPKFASLVADRSVQAACGRTSYSQGDLLHWRKCAAKGGPGGTFNRLARGSLGRELSQMVTMVTG